MRFSRLILFLFLLLGQALGQADERQDFFESRVRPVLSTHCFECHGHKAKGGLKLDSREAALAGGESGPAMAPGKPKESLLLKAIRHIDPDLSMPPKKKLPNHVVNDLKRWIREGPSGAMPTRFVLSRVKSPMNNATTGRSGQSQNRPSPMPRPSGRVTQSMRSFFKNWPGRS